MQHTDKYNFNIIETDDLFSPEALNANARAVEAQLDAVRGEFAAAAAALNGKLSSEKNRVDTALAAKADQTALDALTKTVASNKSAADTALATKAAQTALDALSKTVTANKSAADTALAAKAAQTALTALTTRVAALEQGKLLWKFDSYTGTGEAGADHPTRLEFSFKPLAVFIAHPSSMNLASFLWLRGTQYGRCVLSAVGTASVRLTWEARAVQWFSDSSSSTASYQLNEKNIKYPYFVLGASE